MRAPIAIAAIASLFAAPVAVAQVSPQTVVQRNVDAYRAGDLNRFVATFSHDATVVFNGTQVTGHAQIHNIYRLNFEEDAPQVRIEESSMDGNRIYLKVAYVFADGSVACCSFSEYTVVDGKIVYLHAEGLATPD